MNTESESAAASECDAACESASLDAAELRAVARAIQRCESRPGNMRVSSRSAYRCPYCRENRGLISVDKIALAEGLAGQAETGEGPLPEDLALPSDQRVIGFGPDGVGQGPCPHMIGFWLELHVERHL